LTVKLRCPDCRRRSVVLRRDCYECTLSHSGRNYTPCAWFAFFPPHDPADEAELDRLYAINPEIEIQE
jgi:hypothetical protein